MCFIVLLPLAWAIEALSKYDYASAVATACASGCVMLFLFLGLEAVGPRQSSSKPDAPSHECAALPRGEGTGGVVWGTKVLMVVAVILLLAGLILQAKVLLRVYGWR
jgi:hypothetical protein